MSISLLLWYAHTPLVETGKPQERKKEKGREGKKEKRKKEKERERKKEKGREREESCYMKAK